MVAVETGSARLAQDPDGKVALEDRRRLARGTVLNAVGVAANGVLSLGLVVVVTRGLPQGRAGVFLEAVAVFAILSTLAELGADDAVLRTIPRFGALGRTAQLRGLLAVALGPVLVVGAMGGAVLAALAEPLSRALVHGRHLDPAEMVPFLHVFAPFLPLAAALTVILAATRGFETMVPNALLGNVLRPGLRAAFVFAAVSAGAGSAGIALSWALPVALTLVASAAWLASLVRRATADAHGVPLRLPGAGASLAPEFWRFAAPRALSSTFGITVTWLDTLLVAAFLTSRDAAVYAAAGRLLMVGLLALGPVQLVLAPMMSRFLAAGERPRAQATYRTATEWVMLASWPLYASFAVFAPFVLRMFGSGYPAGQTALLILSIAGMVNVATGPCLTVLLMGGRSGWTLAVAAAALISNVGLNLALIPRLGIAGAALTWGIGIALSNVAGLILVRRLMGLSPFGRGALVIASAAVLCFGGVGLIVRYSVGMTLGSVALAEIVAAAAYAALLWRAGGSLHLPELRTALAVRRRARQPPL